jgi:hypothetical protein
VDATSTAGTAADEREHVEEGHAQQPEADRRGDADDAAEQQLPAEPGTDLHGDGPRHQVDARALRLREDPQEGLADVAGIDQQVERQDQDREEPDDPADDATHRAEDGPDRVTAADRCLLDGLLPGDRMLQQPAVEQEQLRAIEHLPLLRPEVPRLFDDRRDDDRADRDQRADDEDVEDEDRHPAREAA